MDYHVRDVSSTCYMTLKGVADIGEAIEVFVLDKCIKDKSRVQVKYHGIYVVHIAVSHTIEEL